MASKGADAFYMFSKSSLETLGHLDGGRITPSTPMLMIASHLGRDAVDGAPDISPVRLPRMKGRRARANPVMKHEVMRWLKSRSGRCAYGGMQAVIPSSVTSVPTRHGAWRTSTSASTSLGPAGVASNLTRQREVEQPG